MSHCQKSGINLYNQWPWYICMGTPRDIYSNMNKRHNSSALSQKRKRILRAVQTLKTNSYFIIEWHISEIFLKMCCSDDGCDADIFMFVLRCFVKKKNRRFVGRVFFGMVLDGMEGLSIEFNEVDDNNFNIVMVVLTAFFLFNLVLLYFCQV